MKPNFNLEDQPRKNAFSVPENYFDKLPNRVMQRVSAKSENLERGMLSTFRLALTGSGIAVAFAAIFMLNSNPELTTKNPVTDPFASLTTPEIQTYLLASGQVEQTDLALLDATEKDFTPEFINAGNAEINLELEDQTIEDIYL